MKKLIIFGGSGGLGTLLTENLSLDFDVTSLSSKDCNITTYKNINQQDAERVLLLSCVNVDSLIRKTSTSDILEQIDVNCIGAVNVIRYFTGYWKDLQRPGKIVLMSSFLSTRPVKGAGIYSASKAFIDNLVKTSSLEAAKDGITINSIQAGYFEAGLTHKLPKSILEKLPSTIPVGRVGKIEELALAIRFLFQNDYVTGSNLMIDGGVSLV